MEDGIPRIRFSGLPSVSGTEIHCTAGSTLGLALPWVPRGRVLSSTDAPSHTIRGGQEWHFHFIRLGWG